MRSDQGVVSQSGCAGSRPLVSVVIPARNEEGTISRTLRSVRRALLKRVSYEIIVVDDQSTDRTRELAKSQGAYVVVSNTETIGGSRNEGEKVATGEVLVFLDADVTVTEEWGKMLAELLPDLRGSSKILTGGMCSVPEDSGWIERHWFDSRLRKGTHVGSAHMIINRQFFNELEGFDVSLSTGEDYDLSMRAREAGGHIRPHEDLVAIHHGFPTTVRQFLIREIWHGTGDASSLRTLLTSRVVWASLGFFLFHVLVLLGTVIRSVPMIAFGGGGVILLVGAAVLQKFGVSGQVAWLRVFFLYYVYFWGRLIGVLLRSRNLGPVVSDCASRR